jgi:hypothetical protein
MLDKYNGQKIRQRFANGIVYISATDMEKATKVELVKWRNSSETIETILALHKQTGYDVSNSDIWVRHTQLQRMTNTNEISENYLIEVRKGTDAGTWYHEDLAIAYAYSLKRFSLETLKNYTFHYTVESGFQVSQIEGF